MSLAIQPTSPLAEPLRERILQTCEHASQMLDKREEAPHKVVHEVRKDFKKVRGILRLMRDAVPFYKQENVFFRDEARKISDIRDATSVLEALEKLYEQHEEQLYQKAFDEVQTILETERREQSEKVFGEQHVLEEINERLNDKKGLIRNWAIPAEEPEDLLPGLHRVYKRGYKMYRKSARKPSPENYHTWRKRIKYLRYQLRVLRKVWPPFFKTWEEELHELSDLLGTDRDLMMLRDVLQEKREAFSDEKNRHTVQSLIAGQRQALQQHALLMGRKLYSLKPESFIRLVEQAWKSHQKEAGTALTRRKALVA